MNRDDGECFDAFAQEKRREINEAIKEINALTMKVADLKRYAQHLNHCQTFAHPLERLPFDCTCGLEKLLK